MVSETEGPEIITLPSDKVILLDLDKTLIDSSYNITDPAITDEIQRVQGNGWKLGLISDTPLETLLAWNNQLHMNGPIMAERGAVIYDSGETEILFPSEQRYFEALKTKFIDDLAGDRLPFYHGDITRFLNNSPVLTGTLEDTLILVNGYRRCSFSAYSRKIDESGKLQIDLDSLEELRNRLNTASANIQRGFTVHEDVNPDYGIVILSPEAVNKRNATKIWMEKNGIRQVGIIGDSGTDILGNDIAIHYAVGNATEEFKKVATYTAPRNITSGVIDILSQIR